MRQCKLEPLMMHIHTTHQCKVARKAEARRVSPTPDDVKDIYLGFYSHDVRVDMYRVATLYTNEIGYEQIRFEVGAVVTMLFRCLPLCHQYTTPAAVCQPPTMTVMTSVI